MTTPTTELLADTMAAFVVDQAHDTIPDAARRWVKLLILDAIGNAYAASRFEFASMALIALSGLGGGESSVINVPQRLALRDAVLMNGVLVHGLDYDDTYLPGAIHLTASCVPTALGVAEQMQANGSNFLTACLLGLEVGARLSAAAKGSFLKAGFHPTSVIGTFASTLIAGRLMQMTRPHLVMAQGMALSFASGTMQSTQEGAWAKRMHGGWAGAAGITAAAVARQGFSAPFEAYEGLYGLFPCFLGAHAADAELELAVRNLGEKWEIARSSVKLYPACYHLHAFMNAVIELKAEQRLDIDNIESVRGLVAETTVPLVCEPLAARRKPHNSYSAQFSLPYAIACCLGRGRFGLEEIEESAYSDPQLLALAQKVNYEIDPNAGFPKYRSGEVVVRLKNGREISKRNNIFPDEQAAEKDIFEKFTNNTKLALAPSRAASIRDMMLNIESVANMRTVMSALAGRSM